MLRHCSNKGQSKFSASHLKITYVWLVPENMIVIKPGTDCILYRCVITFDIPCNWNTNGCKDYFHLKAQIQNIFSPISKTLGPTKWQGGSGSLRSVWCIILFSMQRLVLINLASWFATLLHPLWPNDPQSVLVCYRKWGCPSVAAQAST